MSEERLGECKISLEEAVELGLVTKEECRRALELTLKSSLFAFLDEEVRQMLIARSFARGQAE